MNGQLQQQLQVLSRLYKESDHIYSRLASKLGMTDTTFWVLYAIAHSEEALTQNDLCSDFFFPVQTIHSARSTKRMKSRRTRSCASMRKNGNNIFHCSSGTLNV